MDHLIRHLIYHYQAFCSFSGGPCHQRHQRQDQDVLKCSDLSSGATSVGKKAPSYFKDLNSLLLIRLKVFPTDEEEKEERCVTRLACDLNLLGDIHLQWSEVFSVVDDIVDSLQDKDQSYYKHLKRWDCQMIWLLRNQLSKGAGLSYFVLHLVTLTLLQTQFPSRQAVERILISDIYSTLSTHFCTLF